MILGISIFLLMGSCSNSTKGTSNNESFTETNKGRDSLYAQTIASYANVRSNYFDSSSGSGSTGEVCGQILRDGTMRYYKYTNIHDYKAAMKNAINLEEEEFSSLDDSKAASLGISLPMLKGLSSFYGDYNSNHEEMNYLKKKYSDNSTLEISDEDLNIIEQQIGDPTIVNAWKECIFKAFESERGIRAFISGDEFGDFVLNLNYFPINDADKKNRKVYSIDFSENLEKIGTDKIKKGAILENYTGLSQSFKRTNNKLPAYIQINVKGVAVQNIKLKSFVEKPLEAVYSKKWMKVDEQGNNYFQSFVINHPQCWDCNDDDKFIISSQTLNLNETNGKIYEIKRECVGSGCGWNYSPVPGEGYADNIKILSNNSFFIQRLIKGPSCTETYTAYYEKERNVCSENCK